MSSLRLVQILRHIRDNHFRTGLVHREFPYLPLFQRTSLLLDIYASTSEVNHLAAYHELCYLTRD
jgi:hypothetical protein